MIEPWTTTMRRDITDLLRAESSLPVLMYLPDDVAHLPCLVVGRPGKTEGDAPAVMTMRLDVVLLGRRINDDDAQAELDAYDDETFSVLGGTRGFKVADSHYHCSEVRAGTTTVAALDYPAYSYIVARDIVTC